MEDADKDIFFYINSAGRRLVSAAGHLRTPCSTSNAPISTICIGQAGQHGVGAAGGGHPGKRKCCPTPGS